MDIMTFIEKRPTATGCPQVVVCRLSNDDTYEIARGLEDAIIEQGNEHDGLKAKVSQYEETAHALIEKHGGDPNDKVDREVLKRMLNSLIGENAGLKAQAKLLDEAKK